MEAIMKEDELKSKEFATKEDLILLENKIEKKQTDSKIK